MSGLNVLKLHSLCKTKKTIRSIQISLHRKQTVCLTHYAVYEWLSVKQEINWNLSFVFEHGF